MMIDEKTEQKEFFELYTPEYLERGRFRDRIKRILLNAFPVGMLPELRFFKKYDRQKAIVELGCGTGEFLYQLERMQFKNLIGVEYASYQNFKIRSIVKADILSYLQGVSDRSVDCFIMLDVLEHFDKPTVLQILNLLYQKLKTGGFFIGRVPNIMTWSGQFNQYSDYTHHMIFTEDLLYHLSRRVGFQNIKIYSSEKWVKLFIDPRRWPALMMFLVSFCIRRLWRLGFGGPKIYTLNVTVRAEKLD